MEFYDLVNGVTIQSDIEVWNLDEDDNEELVFSLDNVNDLALCFYPEDFDEHCEVAFMYVSHGKLIVEVRNAWLHDKTSKAFYRAIDRVNKAYDSEDYDIYEKLLERYARKFGKPVWQFEDDCTDVRLYGKNAC